MFEIANYGLLRAGGKLQVPFADAVIRERGLTTLL